MMRRVMGGEAGFVFVFAFASSLACSVGCGPGAKPAPAPPTAVASAAPRPERTPAPDSPRPVLRTGGLEPVVHAEPLSLEIAGRTRDGDFELLELKLPPEAEVLGGPDPRTGAPDRDTRWGHSVVVLDTSASAFAFAGPIETADQRDEAYNGEFSRRSEAARKAKRPAPVYDPPRGPLANSVWIRRPSSTSPPRGKLFTPAGELPGHAVAFAASAPPQRDDPALKKRWAKALVAHFRLQPGPFADFAEQRVRQLFLHETASPFGPEVPAYDSAARFARLMDTTSGRISVQAALQHDRHLFASERRAKRSIPIESVKAPNVPHQDWAALGKRLGRSVPDEPLSRATPADFYFVRSRAVETLFDLIDELEDWGQPLADWIDGSSQDRDTFARYQTELGLATTGLGALLGPKIVSEVALVGSDPYVHQGTDVTLIVRPKDAKLWSAALATMLTARKLEHGPTAHGEFVHEGVTVSVARSANGRIRRHTASASGLELVSNSPNALRRVLSTLLGKMPRLADEPDFRYLLARDAGVPEHVLAYAGDRFVASVISPAQKIAEARRQLALAELSLPGYSYLLSGTLSARLPESLAALIASKMLARSELVHADGAPIAFEPESGASSRWGSPMALEPLIDLPAVTHVSELEKAAYAHFASSYQREWSDYLDPVALRLSLSEAPSGERTLISDLRVLPLLRGEYREFTEMVGRASVSVPPLDSGARVVFGIGADARLRRELGRTGQSFLGGGLHFDWVGGYAGIGIENKNRILEIVLPEFRRALEPPEPSGASRPYEYSDARLAGLPAYAFVSVRNAGAVGIALTVLREKIDQVAPGIVEWMQPRRYRDASVVEVRLRPDRELKFSVFYALTPKLLVVSLREEVLESALDRLLDQPPSVAQAGQPAPRGASQLAIDLAAEPGTALALLASWVLNLVALEAAERSAATAEAVLRADPARAGDSARVRKLMKNSFGTVVTTPEGKDYTLSPDGVRDPVRGTRHAPLWPELPIAGSTSARLLERLRRVRSELSFDDEPPNAERAPAQSLRARVTIDLGK